MLFTCNMIFLCFYYFGNKNLMLFFVLPLITPTKGMICPPPRKRIQSDKRIRDSEESSRDTDDEGMFFFKMILLFLFFLNTILMLILFDHLNTLLSKIKIIS